MRNFTKQKTLHTLVAAVFLALTAGAAQAADPAFVGTWADDPAQCKKSQETSDAPLVITAKGYDQHETHCDFTSVDKKGDGWSVKTKCSVEGDTQTPTIEMSVKGDTLSLGFEGEKPDTLKRC